MPDLDRKPELAEATPPDPATARAVEDVVAQLKAGRTLAEIAAAQTPDDERELLRRCAWVRTFDEAVVARVLRPFNPPVPEGGVRFDSPVPIPEADVPFARLVAHPLVEAVPGQKGVYRVRDRAALLANPPGRTRAWADYDERVASRLLMHFYQERGEALEVLYHQAVGDPDAAHAWFVRRFRAAEKRYDLAACDALVRALDRPGLDPALAAARDTRAAWLRTRGMWVEDFFRTARFIDRRRLTAALDRLLAPAGPHVALQLHAPGGQGKTQFVRWMLARRCADRRVPCARLDFDEADAAKFAAEPAAFALNLARQFNRQLANAPFGPLLKTLELATDRADVKYLDQFARVLNDTLPGVAVLVLDTLEEVLLPRKAVLLDLLDAAAGLVAACPPLRLVLSGRYELRERLKDDLPNRPAAALFRTGATITRVVPPFTRAESRAYLTDLNDLPDDTRADKARVRAIIDRSGRIPLKLSLYAELVLAAPRAMTAEAIRADPDVDVAYLIRRVVMRLRNPDETPADDLRLVLRYGAIPRQLTAEFVRDVLIPNWAATIAADSLAAGLERLPTDEPPFRSTEPPDAARVWARLREYASASSWVRFPAEAGAAGEPEVLILQNEVANPMRELLQKASRAGYRAFDLLHAAAIRHFSSRAEAEPDAVRRAAWLAEVTYHDFQLRGALAGSDWRARLTDAALAAHPAARLALAEAVIERPFLDDANRPRPRPDGSLMIDWADLAFARFHAARARADRGLPAEDRAWRDAADDLGGYDAARAEVVRIGGAEPVPAVVVEHVRGAVLFARGRHAEALEAYRRAGDLNGEASTLVALGRRSEAVAAYAQVADELVKSTSGRDVRAELAAVWEKLAEQLAASDLYAEAADLFLSAATAARTTGNATLARRVELRHARALLASGHAEEAERVLGPVEEPPAVEESAEELEVRAAVVLLRADARFAQARLFGTAEGLREIPDPVRIDGHRLAPVRRVMAATQELEGRISAALMTVASAENSLNQAQSLWAAAQRPDAVARVRLALVRLSLDVTGDRVEAEARLRERNRLEPTHPYEVYLVLAEAELRDLQGRGEDAQALIADVVGRLTGTETPPSVWVKVALTGLAFRTRPDPNRFLKLLVQHLRHVTPAGARAMLLAPLARCPGPLADLDPATVTEFLGLLPLLGTDPEPAWTPRERALCACRVAEAARVVGRNADARRLLSEAAPVLLREGETLFPLRDLLAALDRAGDRETAWELGRRWLPAFLAEFGNYQNLGDVAALDHANGALSRGNIAEATALVEAVERTRPLESPDRFPLLRARVMTVRAALALLGGRMDAVHALTNGVSDLYTALGQPNANVMLLQAGTPATERVDDPPLFPVPPALVVVLERVSGTGVHVAEYRAPDRTAVSPRIQHPLFAERSFEYAAILAGHGVASAEEFAQVFVGAPLEERTLDVCLFAPEPEQAFLPWEWAVGRWPGKPRPRGSDGVRYVYRGGDVPGSEEAWLRAALGVAAAAPVADAVRAFQARNGLPPTGAANARTRHAAWLESRRASGPPRVVVIRGMYESVGTGTDEEANLVAGLYRASGFDPVFWPNDTAGELDALFRVPDPPVLVHAVVGLEDVPSLGVCLQLEMSGSNGLLGPSRLRAALQAMPPTARRPVVVLDPPRPASISEAVHRLLLRNAFAAELFHTGAAPVVIATGLAEYAQREPLARCVVECVAGGWTAGGLLDALRRQGGEGPPGSDRAFAGWLAPASAALFATDPESRLPGFEVSHSAVEPPA